MEVVSGPVAQGLQDIETSLAVFTPSSSSSLVKQFKLCSLWLTSINLAFKRLFI